MAAQQKDFPDGQYTGQLSENGQRSGTGTIKLLNGCTYTGSLRFVARHWHGAELA